MTVFLRRIEQNVELRLLQAYHAEQLFLLSQRNRAYLQTWLPTLDFTLSVNHSRKYINLSLEQYANREGLKCGIWYDGKLAGLIGHYKMDWMNKNTCLEYWLGEEFSGQGLMTKACQAMVDYALNDLKLHRVEIRCAVENRKSRAIPERLGFEMEGIVREVEWLHDHYVDHALYSMLDRDWPRR